jgi:hypothetical protein
MNNASPPEQDETLSDGRYIYCLVNISEDTDPELATDGIGDNRVSFITHEDIGAVTHQCDQLYDSEEATQIRQWLVTHQQVIDTVGSAFGTPLPFQFDVILQGGEESVKQWMADNETQIREALNRFRGLWEYRAHVTWDRSTVESVVSAADERLAEIEAQRNKSGEGTQFLLDKRYEQRLEDLLHRRKTELRDQLQTELRDVVDEMEQHAAEPSVQAIDQRSDEQKEWVARIALLASSADEGSIGTKLDTIASEPGVTVEFTGPWPPYSFTPEFTE